MSIVPRTKGKKKPLHTSTRTAPQTCSDKVYPKEKLSGGGSGVLMSKDRAYDFQACDKGFCEPGSTFICSQFQFLSFNDTKMSCSPSERIRTTTAAIYLPDLFNTKHALMDSRIISG